MATIETRHGKNGEVTYRARVRVQGHPERRATFQRKTHARSWATQTESDLKRGRYVPTNEATRRTIGDLVDRYINETLPDKKRNKNHAATTLQLKWWKEHAGSYYLASCTPSMIAEFKEKLRHGDTHLKRQRSGPTVNRYLAALGAALKTATREWGWLEVSPMARVTRFEESGGRTRCLDDDERGRLLKACSQSKSEALYPIVILALSTGARRGEILGLRWRDVDLKRGVAVLQDTKNGDKRVLPLAGPALQLLRDRAKIRRIDSELVFPSLDGKKPINVREGFTQALKVAEITDFRFHDLRHTAASYLAMNGASLMEIAAILGHKTLAMVKRYSHLSEQHVSAVVTSMNNKIFGEP